jgi:lipoprotein signal peptidase
MKLRSLVLISLCGGLFGCDHATKIAAEHALSGGRVVSLVPNVLELRYARNDDVAFSALSSWEIPHKGAVLLALSLVILAMTVQPSSRSACPR